MFVLVPTGAPALASSGTLMSLRTTPPLHACQPQPERAGPAQGREVEPRAPPRAPTPTGACRCTFRKRHQGTLSGALRSEARRERSAREGGFPCRSAGRCAPAASWRGTRTNTVPPATAVLLAKAGRKLSPSCRSCPAAHSHEREPNAPRSAPHPASNQCRGPPRRCRCAPPARAQPNRQCR